MKNLCAGVFLIVLGCLWIGCERVAPRTGGAGVGEPMPELSAVGWINGEPNRAELRGHVVVIDLWATWCGPCATAAPELVETYIEYRERGVRFAGLTAEPSTEIKAIGDFANRFSMTWPIGYGAGPTFDALGILSIPAVVIVGRDGKIARKITGYVEGELEAALAEIVGE
jgi:thiol-disulfide isomerase/thioredoxin